MPPLYPHDFDWELYEISASSADYRGVDHSIEFVLAPVRDWPGRMRLAMEDEMMDRETGKPFYSWKEFVNAPSLIAQLSQLAVQGPSPDATGTRDRFEKEWEYILLNSERVREGLDWIWKMFCARLANRAHLAASEEGTWALEGLCDGITARFDYHQCKKEWNTDDVSHELFYVLSTSGWNGWEEWAWLRFIESVDKARTEFIKTARAAERDRFERSSRASEERSPDESDMANPHQVFVRGCYYADEYAESLWKAFSADPARFQSGRASFKKLRDAAGLSVSQERSVKRWIGYEGNATGFDDYISLLRAKLQKHLQIDGEPENDVRMTVSRRMTSE